MQFAGVREVIPGLRERLRWRDQFFCDVVDIYEELYKCVKVMGTADEEMFFRAYGSTMVWPCEAPSCARGGTGWAESFAEGDAYVFSVGLRVISSDGGYLRRDVAVLAPDLYELRNKAGVIHVSDVGHRLER